VEITDRVRNMDIKYGREDEFSQPSAGSLELELDNADGNMDPDNTAGAYYGDLLPLTWFRVRGGDSSVDTDLFYGQASIEGFRLEASQFGGQMVARVTVLDMLEQLANTDLPESVWALEVAADAPEAWYRLGESSGTVAVDSSGNGHDGAYLGGATFNSRSGLVANSRDSAIEFSGTTAGVSIPAAAVPALPLTVEFLISSDGPTATNWVIARTDSVAGNAYAQIQFRTTGGILAEIATGTGTGQHFWESTVAVNDGATHHVVVRFNGASTKIYVDSVDVTGADTGFGAHPAAVPGPWTLFPVGVPDDGSAIVDELVFYPGVLDAVRIAAHYSAATAPWEGYSTGDRISALLNSIDFPPAPDLRSIEYGDSTVQAATLDTDALSALQEVAKAEGGLVYVDHHDGGKVRFDHRSYRWTQSTTSQATFGDGPGEVTYTGVQLEDDRIVNVASVQRAGGATVTVEDAASVAQYQRRTFSDTGLLFPTDAEAQYRAALVVAEKKDRHRRVRSVTLEPAAVSHPAWPEVFARRIADRVDVKWRPPYGGAYTFPAYVEGVEHHWAPGASAPWRTVFHLSAVPYGGTGTAYWLLGTSVLGTDTRPGY
jgi:hypothetical protein